MGAVDVVTIDPDDNRGLEAAVAGQADYVVTNDDALLGLKSYQDIEIVSAARFMAILES